MLRRTQQLEAEVAALREALRVAQGAQPAMGESPAVPKRHKLFRYYNAFFLSVLGPEDERIIEYQQAFEVSSCH